MITCIQFESNTIYNRLSIFDSMIIITGSSLSQDGKIAIASSISIAIAASVLFSTFGYLCGLHRQKKKSTSSADKPTPVYEDILPKKEHEQKLELKSNVAYASINEAT